MSSGPNSFNQSQVKASMHEQYLADMNEQVMDKCTQNCFLSMKENKLLPTEERCVRNCSIKSYKFNEWFQSETEYHLRNFMRTTKWDEGQ